MRILPDPKEGVDVWQNYMRTCGNYDNYVTIVIYPCEQLVGSKEGLLFDRIYCLYLITANFMYEMLHINI